MPKISPARAEKLTSRSGMPKWPMAGMLSLLTTKRSAPKSRTDGFWMVLRFPPIIFSAIDRELSILGMQVSTSLPPRKIVAVWHSALISCSLCEM